MRREKTEPHLPLNKCLEASRPSRRPAGGSTKLTREGAPRQTTRSDGRRDEEDEEREEFLEEGAEEPVERITALVTREPKRADKKGMSTKGVAAPMKWRSSALEQTAPPRRSGVSTDCRLLLSSPQADTLSAAKRDRKGGEFVGEKLDKTAHKSPSQAAAGSGSTATPPQRAEHHSFVDFPEGASTVDRESHPEIGCLEQPESIVGRSSKWRQNLPHLWKSACPPPSLPPRPSTCPGGRRDRLYERTTHPPPPRMTGGGARRRATTTRRSGRRRRKWRDAWHRLRCCRRSACPRSSRDEGDSPKVGVKG